MLKRLFFLAVLMLSAAAIILTGGCLNNILPRVEETEEGEVTLPEEAYEEKVEEKQGELIVPEGMLPLQLYFMEEQTGYLVPVTVFVPWTESIARTSLEKLVKGPTPGQEMIYGFRALLPPTTEIQGLTIREGRAYVDFNQAFLNYDPEQERNVLNSIIFTLLQFATVDEVEFWVNGETLETFPGGTPGRNPFGRERGVNLQVDEGLEDFQQTTLVTLYFCMALGDHEIFYVPISRVLSGEQDLLEASLKELIQGPRQGTSLFSDLPTNTVVKEANIHGTIATVSLSKELLNYQGGRTGEENIKNQLVLTLTEIPGVENVQVQVEGEPVILTYNTSLLDPIPRPLIINPVK